MAFMCFFVFVFFLVVWLFNHHHNSSLLGGVRAKTLAVGNNFTNFESWHIITKFKGCSRLKIAIPVSSAPSAI